MDGVTRVLILGFLDKSVWVDVFRESHGGGEKQNGASWDGELLYL